MLLQRKARATTGKHIRKRKMPTCKHTWVAVNLHWDRLKTGIENSRGKKMFSKLSLSSKYSEN